MPVRKSNSTTGKLFQFLKNAASLAANTLTILFTGNASLAAGLHNST